MARDTSRLTDEHRLYIIGCFARWQTPQQIADAVKELYGIEISRQAVMHYDPEHSPKLTKKWRELHAEMRKAFREQTAEIAIANPAYRLAVLDSGVRHGLAQTKGRVNALILQALEQAAKETGGAYTNRRELSLDLTNLTDDQLAAIASGRDPKTILES